MAKAGRKKGFKHSLETKERIGKANSNKKYFKCDFCGKDSFDTPSHYAKKKKHFCSQKCHSDYRSQIMKKEEQPRFGTGFPEEEKAKRVKARATLNHYLRDKKITRPVCEICGDKAEAHHDDYDKPLEVKWLCFKHHRLYHKIGNELYSNPELIKQP